MNRPAYKVDSSNGGSDLVGETVAALAASAMFYEADGDNGLAGEALSHARTLFDFADKYRRKYTDTIPAGNFYK